MTEDSRRKPYFPIFLDLSEKQAVIIGGGTIAERRLRILRGFVGSIRIVAPKITDAVREMIRSGGRDERPGEEALCGAAQIIWREKWYEADDLTGADLVLACTDDPERNSEIYRTCRELEIPVNDCSDKSQCDFYFPGVVLKDGIVIGINGSGTAHRKVKAVRQKIEEALECGHSLYDEEA